MPWWLLHFAVIGIGWVLVNAAVYFHYEHLGILLQATSNPSQEMIDTANADGAPRVFALLFGWAYGILYLIPWLCVYGACHLTRRNLVEPLRAANGG